mgnify:CR=1 FL=1
MYTANPFPVMKTGFSLCSFSHREIPVMKTGSLQWEQGSPVMKTGFSLCGKTTQGKPCNCPVRDCSALWAEGGVVSKGHKGACYWVWYLCKKIVECLEKVPSCFRKWPEPCFLRPDLKVWIYLTWSPQYFPNFKGWLSQNSFTIQITGCPDASLYVLNSLCDLDFELWVN